MAANLILLGVLTSWRAPRKAPETLPAERLVAAMSTGLRYAQNNRDLDATLIRAVAFFPFASAYWALMPLIAKGETGDGAELFGLLMGLLGLGSIVGSLALETLKARLGPDRSAALGALGTVLALALFAASRRPEIAMVASFIAGASWIVALTTMFVSAQVALPDWVRGRGLAIFLTAYFGAMTVGSALWGEIAAVKGLPFALFAAAAGAALGLGLTWRWKLETGAAQDLAPSMHWKAPAFVQRLEGDDGPVLAVVEYRIDPKDAREFLALMQEIGHERMRDGAYAWNIFEDPDEAGRFIETSLTPLAARARVPRRPRDPGGRTDRGASRAVPEGAAEAELLRRLGAPAHGRRRRRAGPPRRVTADLEAKGDRKSGDGGSGFAVGEAARYGARPRRGDRSRATRTSAVCQPKVS